MCGFGVCSHLTVSLSMSVQGVGMTRRVRPLEKVSPELSGPWANDLIVPSGLSRDFCKASKAGSWAPSPRPNRGLPNPCFPTGPGLPTWLSYSGCLPSGRRLLAFCYSGRFDHQSQCQGDGGLSHCLSVGLILS